MRVVCMAILQLTPLGHCQICIQYTRVDLLADVVTSFYAPEPACTHSSAAKI